MNIEKVQEAVNNAPKGANIVVEWERPVKLLAAYKNMPMFKRCRAVCRIGIDNDKRKATIEARANGTRPETNQGIERMGLKWIQFPCLLQKIKDENQYYIRLENGTGKTKTIPTFFISEAGKETVIKKEDWEHTMRSEEKRKKDRDPSAPFNIKIENIKRVHYVFEDEDETETIEA